MTEQNLEELLTEGPQSASAQSAEEPQALSRRKFLTGAVVGGAAGLAVAAGTGVAVWQVADAELLTAKDAAEAALQENQSAAEAELARMQGLVDLYENLEKIGLDAILETGMTAVALPVAAVEVGAKALKAGLDWAEEALLALGKALPTARESILWLEDQVSLVAGGIEQLETAVRRALNRVTDNPVAEALGDFATMILDNLPFSLGDKIRNVLDGMVVLVTSVDELVAGVNSHLLEPLREGWFAEEDGKGLAETLIDPLVENILDPLESHLVNLAVLADNWHNDLMAPSQQALAERSEVHQEILQYKKDNGFL
jgi:hypothetical protein